MTSTKAAMNQVGAPSSKEDTGDKEEVERGSPTLMRGLSRNVPPDG